jgi:hypothetical protein
VSDSTRTITVTTLRPETRPETDPLMGRFFDTVTETRETLRVEPPGLFATDPALLPFSAKLLAAARALLATVRADGVPAGALTISVVLEEEAGSE